MPVKELLELIASQRTPPWAPEDVAMDLEVLRQNRIRSVGELRILSKYSWAAIPLLPIVKDLLIMALNGKRDKVSKKEMKYRVKAAERQLKVEADQCGERELALLPSNGRARPAPLTEDSSDSDDEGDVNNNGTLPSCTATASPDGGRPSPGAIKTLSISRMRVAAGDGQIYEVNRICPHKHADMSTGKVVGTTIYCPKHDWGFDMAAGGVCRQKNKFGKYTLAACRVNDW